MAVLALGFVVPSGFWGAAVGWQALAYGAAALIDSRLVLPAMFPPPDAPKPNIGDFEFNFAEEGAYLQPLLGPECKAVGGLIWASEVITEEVNEDVGGCGGSGSTTTGYNHYRHVQIVIGECMGTEGIKKVLKVWRDSEVFFEDETLVDITSNQITASIYEEVESSAAVISASNASPIRVRAALAIATGDRVRVTGCLGNTAANGSWTVTDVADVPEFDLDGSTGNGTYVGGSGAVGKLVPFLQLTAPDGSVDLSALRVGVDTVISGFTAPATANNGTWKCVFAGTLSAGGTVARFEHPNPVAKAAGDSVTVFQDPPQFNPKNAVDVHFNLGAFSDVPDALIEGIEGVGNVPAYHQQPNMVVEKLLLSPGGRIGEFKFLVQCTDEPTGVAEVLGQLMERAAFASTEYEVDDVTENFGGMATGGVGSTTGQLQPICVAYDVLAQQRGEVVRFFDRSAAEVVTVVSDDLAAYHDGDEHPDPIVVPDPSDSSLPDQIDVTFVDPRNDWQTGNAHYRNRKVVIAEEIARINLSMTLEGAYAAGVARRILWLAKAQRHRPRLALPPSYLSDAIEGNVLEFELDDEPWRVMATKVDVGSNYLIRLETEVDDEEIASILSGPYDDPLGDQPPPIGLPGEMKLVLADLPPLVSARVGAVGFYWGAALEDVDEIFAGGALYHGDGSSFAQLDQMVSETTIGVATTVLLGSGVRFDTTQWDKTVDIELRHGVLESKTLQLFLGGANRALIGNEVIAFRNAVVTGSTVDGRLVYRLSGLRRGLYDTRDQVNNHMVGERFMLLNSTGMRFVDLGLGQLLNLRHYKAIVSGGSLTQATDVPFSVDGACVRHWSPCQGYVALEASSGDAEIRWKRRALAPFQVFDDPPLFDDGPESYEVEVWDSGFATLKRTLTSSVESVAYSAADQTTDFGAPQTTFYLRVFQMHALTGRSKPLEMSAATPQRYS